MRKRKTIAAKRITAKAVTGVPRFFGILNDPLGNQVENQLMEREEKEQRRVDNFWGQDKDLRDREAEKLLMMREDDMSRRNEQEFEKIALQMRWDEEFHRNQWFEYKDLALRREQEREMHLRYLTAAQSTEAVMSQIWKPNIAHEQISNNHSSHISPISGESGTRGNQEEMGIVSSDGPNLFAQSTVDAIHMSVHLDGLQQSRAIVDKASFTFKNTLRRINSQSVDEGEASEPFKVNPISSELDRRKRNAAVSSFFESSNTFPSSDKTQEVDDALAMMRISGSAQYNACLDGHPVHGWDQVSLLEAAFEVMDVKRNGWLSRAALSEVSHSPEVHQYLRFTVFWDFIKRRDWCFFESLLLENAQSRNDSSHSSTFGNEARGLSRQLIPIRNGTEYCAASKSERNVSEHRVDESIIDDKAVCTYSTWLAAADRISYDENVPLRFIRTQEEHLSINKDGAGGVPAFTKAPKAAEFSILPERETRVSRSLGDGDCVWALHRGGAVWFPAVIRKITKAENLTAIGESNYMYDLWFPLTEIELQRARALTTSRHLLTLPSGSAYSRVDGVHVSGGKHINILQPKPIEDERGVCAYAFDLVDSSGAGIVPLDSLIGCMQSKEFDRIIATSSALQLIFSNERKSSDNDGSSTVRSGAIRTVEVPSLLPVFVDTFKSSGHEEQKNDSKENPSKSGKAEGGGFSTDGCNGSEVSDGYYDSNNDFDSYTAEGSQISSKVIGTIDDTAARSPEQSPDWISKLDFLEFCQAVVEVKKYSVESII